MSKRGLDYLTGSNASRTPFEIHFKAFESHLRNGATALEYPVHTHDFHATILHLMGIDHTRLTYRYSGRDFRLTDVHGVVAKDILA